MRKALMLGVVALFVMPSVVRAQEHAEHAEAEHGEHGSGVASIQPLYEQFKTWLIAAAEQMPEGKYGFQPTTEVRTFGQLVGHLANAGYFFCSNATGGESPASSNYEELTSRSRLIEELKTMFEYCDAAYAMSDMKAMEPASLMGQENTRLWVLNFNAIHNAEHYGNIVTYLRMNGLTPPSSQEM